MKKSQQKQFEGKVTLQLHNAVTGELEKEISTTNFASNQTNEYGKWLQKSILKAGLSALSVPDTVYSPHSAADFMVLTTSTQAEDSVNEWYMPGGILGWAGKSTYAGTDIWRGTVSTSAIEANPNYVKWVFDWPSHAGNGIIGSVGWIASPNQVLSATSPEFRQSMSLISTHTSANGWTRFAQASSILAFGNIGNATIYVLNGVYAQTTTFDISAQFASVRGIAWDSGNSFLWVIGDNPGGSRIIAAYNQAGILQTGPFTATNRVYELLAYDGTQLWSITRSGVVCTAWALNTVNGSDISNFNFTLNAASGVCGFTWDASRSVFWTRQNLAASPGIQSWDTSGNKRSVELTTVRIFNPATGANNLNLAATRDFDMTSNFAFAIPSASIVYVCRADGMGTRALLPAPVSKNNTQTLKLIYQINYV